MADDVHEFPRELLGINRLFYRNLVSDMPQLFEAVVQFNKSLQEADKMYDFGNNTILEEVINRSNRAKAMFSKGGSVGFWDFEEESRRIALLDVSILKNLIVSWGSALCAPILNRFVRRDDVEILNKSVGSRYLDFARGKGGFILGDLSKMIKLEEQAVDPEKMYSLIIKYGMHAYSICSAKWPEPLQSFENKKIEKYLPDLFEYRIQSLQVSPSHFRAIWFSMKKILLKEVAPQWTPCFI